MPDDVSPDPEREHHPWRYSARCPECGESADQAGWEIGLLKMWASATGPRTPEGKAKSAQNLANCPDHLKKFNALKHGLYSSTANYFPAKPGKYPDCPACEHMVEMTCLAPPRACLKKLELFLRHRIAFDAKDPGLLAEIRANTQSGIQAMVDWMILIIAQDGGPRIKRPDFHFDSDGKLHLADYIDDDGNLHRMYRYEQHPLLRPLMDYIQKNAMTLADMGMTPKVRDEHDIIQGHLDNEADNKEEAIEYKRRSTEALERLTEMINNSRQQARRDPILIEQGGIDE